MEVFKLLLDVGGNLMSYSATGKAETTYKPGIKTFPPIPNSKLFVFDTMANAMEFAGIFHDGMELWRCETEEAKPMSFCAWNPSDANSIEWFWEGTAFNVVESPDGTLGADWVILKERVAWAG